MKKGYKWLARLFRGKLTKEQSNPQLNEVPIIKQGILRIETIGCDGNFYMPQQKREPRPASLEVILDEMGRVQEVRIELAQRISHENHKQDNED